MKTHVEPMESVTPPMEDALAVLVGLVLFAATVTPAIMVLLVSVCGHDLCVGVWVRMCACMRMPLF